MAWLPEKIKLKSPRLGHKKGIQVDLTTALFFQASIDLPVVPSVSDEWDQV